jgi:DNA modification methylase
LRKRETTKRIPLSALMEYRRERCRTAEITIINGDCIKGMQELVEGSVDAVIADPPYGIDYENTKGVRILNDKRPYIWFLSEAYRVLRDSSACLVFCRWDVLPDFKRAMELAGFRVKAQVVWDKESHGMGDCKGNFAPCHELILFGVKGRYIFPGKRPNDVIHCPKVPSAHMRHPNEKPMALMEALIRAVTREGETILDPFLGSGPTAQACRNTGRKLIGYELEQKYCEIAKKRIEEPF